MPFVKRVVQPTLLCRASDTARTQAGAAPAGRLLQDDSELVAVNNCALSNIIRQLSSLAGHADEIFGQLKAELGQINARASGVRERLESLQARAEDLNARTVTVPEGDLTTYWQHKAHFFKAKQPIVSGLFTPESRPIELQRLYDAAGQTPVLKMRQMDRLRRDGKRASKIFMCTPVLSTEENRKARKRSALTDIETSKPASLSRIREWRSSEVLGSAVAPPDVSLAAPVNASDLLEHLLPSPEEQLSVIARHFPPEMVAVDVTGRNFDRQQRSRRSLSQIDTRRAERHRKRRSLRRNTIAGTSEAELLRQAADGASQLGGSESIEVDSSLQSLPGSKRKLSSDKVSDRVLSHLNSLREWGRLRLSRAREQQQPTDLYETLTHIRRPRSTSPHVRLRAHAGRKNKLDVHSSSGNWSASSSSARASVESSSDHRTTSHLPTSSSSSTCDSALSVRRTKVALSISSSNSRESPDLHVSDSTGFNDGETSSIYSCDTEGYYTSFHVDSGLKTLREEPLESTNSSGNITVCAAAISTKALTCENEYELFGKGSTSTTASSAGTICTVKAPPSPPLRKSSLEHLDVSSDAEAVERRARVRKALDTNRVPSMCVITPPQSEDEQAASPVGSPPPEPQKRASPQLRALLPFNNIVGRVRDALRKSPQKESLPPTPVESPVDEYVTIASTEAAVRVAQGEYVSLNELPLGGGDSGSEGSAKSPANSLERRRRNAGARVLLDSDGKVVYSSDSLRRKPKNTTFEPGPCVKTESPPTRAHQRVIIKAKDVPCTSPPATSAACKAGPHVDMLKLIEQEQQQGEEAHARSENIDPQSWARIRRNESYRLAASQHNNPQQQQQPPPPSAAEDVKRVLNPNTAGRRFYGAKIMVDPGRMGRPLHGALYEPHGSPLGRVTLPSDTQRARVLGSGNDTEIW
ncbi:Hypothetical predicted protein [Cloeon dipterum]|uniref:WASP family protein member n=1 Tax=Cloeon dipterum TaxID=197152 RepID=A0A8S1D8T3_9INSE|nr:Hypothetical predicted protein [Cloeon dipterum]